MQGIEFTYITVLSAALLMGAGCSSDDGGETIYDSQTTEQMTAATVTMGSSMGGSESDSDSDSDSTMTDESMGSTGVKLDLGDNTTMGSGGEAGDDPGCQKVDFLFVIDNSGSMLEEQDNLAGSFPSFINSINSTLDEAQDYHVMVADVDEWVWSGCDVLCLFPLPIPACVGFECGVTQPLQCEDILGAGVTYPRGLNASNQDCDFVSGQRYMTDEEPNLAASFQCAARVGTDSQNDPERPMESMVAAVSGQGTVGQCNQGFLRDDAILVVTFITDEDDDANDGSAGTVETWRQALIDAKQGNEDAIVMLGLFGDGDLPNPVCGGLNNAETSPRLRSFLDSWGDKGLFGSICASDYDEFFQAAVDVIDTTCDNFTPPE